MKYDAKSLLLNLLAVAVGTGVGVLAFVALSLVSLLLAGLIPITDSTTVVFALIIIVAIMSSFLAGFITNLFSEKNKFLSCIITGLSLTIIYLLYSGFKNSYTPFYWILLLVILPGSIASNLIEKKKKT
jgi:hypothetical protein